jgi:hypothetical protein
MVTSSMIHFGFCATIGQSSFSSKYRMGRIGIVRMENQSTLLSFGCLWD